MRQNVDTAVLKLNIHIEVFEKLWVDVQVTHHDTVCNLVRLKFLRSKNIVVNISLSMW